MKGPIFFADLFRISMGFIYLHFGFLKFFPDLSPAELLGEQSLTLLFSYQLTSNGALFLLAVYESLLGLALILGLRFKLIFIFLQLHLMGTFIPLFVYHEFLFNVFPFAPNLEGQYVLKNIVFLTGSWSVLSPYYFQGMNLHDSKIFRFRPFSFFSRYWRSLRLHKIPRD